MHIFQTWQRPTVVLLHSSGSSSRQWERLAETLAPRFRVRVIDFHGHGGQAAWSGDAPMTLADEAALAAPLLEDAGGAHIVGHSYGAAVALKLATMYPDLVRSVAAYEPVLFRWLIDDSAGRRSLQNIVTVADAMRNEVAAGQNESAAQRFIDFWSGPGSWASLPSGKQASIATRIPAVLQQFDVLFCEPLQREELALLSMPMLSISGARTVPITHRVAQLLRSTLRHAKHEVLPEMGHMGPITHAAEVNRRLAEFLHAQTAPVQRAIVHHWSPQSISGHSPQYGGCGP